jgi:hypothetical protein
MSNLVNKNVKLNQEEEKKGEEVFKQLATPEWIKDYEKKQEKIEETP